MCRRFRQIAERLDQFLAPQLLGRFDSSSFHELSQCRSASHRGNASFGQKTDIRNMAVRKLDAQFQDIAAGGILDLDHRVRIVNFARIAGILEVIEELRGIHFRIVT